MMANQPMPRMVTHIKGMKTATVMEMSGNTMTTIMDLEKRRIVTLNSQTRTADVLDGTAGPGGKDIPVPKISLTVKPTGQTRTINGVPCSEHTYTVTLKMDEMMGGQMPPEAAAMLQGVSMRMDGSVWSATTGPGAAEYVAFMKAALQK
jgi:hypothetical protein